MYSMQFVVQHYSPVLSIAGGSETDNGLTGSAHCPLSQPGSVRNFIVLLERDPLIQQLPLSMYNSVGTNVVLWLQLHEYMILPDHNIHRNNHQMY